MPKKLEDDIRTAFDRATEDAGSPEALQLNGAMMPASSASHARAR